MYSENILRPIGMCVCVLAIHPQLFDRFSEHRRLNLRRLILFRLDGRSSQINGIRFRQSNIFHDFSAVKATHPRRVPSLKFKQFIN